MFLVILLETTPVQYNCVVLKIKNMFYQSLGWIVEILEKCIILFSYLHWRRVRVHTFAAHLYPFNSYYNLYRSKNEKKMVNGFSVAASDHHGRLFVLYPESWPETHEIPQSDERRSYRNDIRYRPSSVFIILI